MEQWENGLTLFELRFGTAGASFGSFLHGEGMYSREGWVYSQVETSKE